MTIDDDATTDPLEGEVPPSDPDSESHTTLTPPVCNDCSFARLQAELEEKEIFAGKEGFQTRFFAGDPLDVHWIGIRRPDSLTNRFDDLLVVFYVAPELEDGAVLPPPERDSRPPHVESIEEA